MEHGVDPEGSEQEIWRDLSPLVQYAGQYCHLARMINLSQLQPGECSLHLRVRDDISTQTTTAQASFRVVD
jgi:hypothetical protein